jgi:hypothetical protein
VTLARQLVEAFGDVPAMRALYAPHVKWSLPASIKAFPRPVIGLDAVVAFNEVIWKEYYKPDCTVEVLDDVGDERSSAVRFIYRAHYLPVGRLYENEYTVFVRSGPEGITEVNEGLDTVCMLDFLNGDELGSSFDKFNQAEA